MVNISAIDIIVAHLLVKGDNNILNDTIDSAFASVDYYDSDEDKMASIIRSIIKDHYFADGNKRTALAIYELFMSAGKRPAKYKQEALGKVFEDIAENNYSVEKIREILF